jgi:hypothetical protein
MPPHTYALLENGATPIQHLVDLLERCGKVMRIDPQGIATLGCACAPSSIDERKDDDKGSQNAGSCT